MVRGARSRTPPEVMRNAPALLIAALFLVACGGRATMPIEEARGLNAELRAELELNQSLIRFIASQINQFQTYEGLDVKAINIARVQRLVSQCYFETIPSPPPPLPEDVDLAELLEHAYVEVPPCSLRSDEELELSGDITAELAEIDAIRRNLRYTLPQRLRGTQSIPERARTDLEQLHADGRAQLDAAEADISRSDEDMERIRSDYRQLVDELRGLESAIDELEGAYQKQKSHHQSLINAVQESLERYGATPTDEKLP